MSISEVIVERIKKSKARFFANDNIAEFLQEGDLQLLEADLTDKFADVLKSMVIDIDKDPNTKGTAHRLAKMYLYEIFRGRYTPTPRVASFPNEKHGTARFHYPEDKPAFTYSGLLVVKAKLHSVCAHHFQPVTGIAYIGIIPGEEVIGLSKYIRIAQHVARRGTLQEQLTDDILKAIQKAAKTPNVAVYIEGTHGCVENRGVMAHDSLTQTVELGGQFYSEPDLRKEFYDAISLSKQGVK